jgi:lipoprotein NlpI
MMRFGMALAAVLLLSMPAHAQRAPQWDYCDSKELGTPDLRILNCSLLIESRGLPAANRAIAYYNRGFAWSLKGDLDHAIADYDQAIGLRPNDARAYNNRAIAWEAKGDLGRAIADYDRAIELDPNNAHAWFNRGRAELHSGALPQALADLNRVGELRPQDPYAALWLEIVNRRSNLPSRLAEATKRIDMTTWPAPLVRLYLGQSTPAAVLAAADDPDVETRAIQVCQANFYAGEFALQRGQKDEAKRLFGLAAGDCPLFLDAHAGAVAELKALDADH